MGKTQSRNVGSSGDAQVNIVNSLEDHSAAHESHELKLWIILVVVIAQLLILLYKQNQRAAKKRALKAAVSVAKLDV